MKEAHQRERVDWIDIAKCIGIFAIFLGHFGPATGRLYIFVFQFHRFLILTQKLNKMNLSAKIPKVKTKNIFMFFLKVII